MGEMALPVDLNATEEGPRPWPPISESQHTYIGIYLVTVGVLGTLDNALVVAMFTKFKVLLTPSNLLLLNLCISDLGICLLGGFPFSGVSSLAGRWLYGDAGCQYYAFMGFLAGMANVTTLLMIAIDRYLVTCRSDLRVKLTYRRYYQMILFIWCWALFWSVMPLFGWASYGYEPSVTTCTINWQHNDMSYKSYITILCTLGYAIPLVIMISCYYRASAFIRANQEHTYDWANEKSVTKMGAVLVLAYLSCWSAYAVVALWTVFAHPHTVPLVLTLMPPLLAKVSPVLNPIIYFYSNPRLRMGMTATLTCCFRPPPPELLELPETKRMTGDK
ncbi:visual pigment-like receptor peropsin [Oratosquilla oratoria]|uniref:visual pigment-like receptor peropsin n=1 Tax=Oratosquilla oratoria TaxID=337810 RepID=UPI003F75D61F